MKKKNTKDNTYTVCFPKFGAIPPQQPAKKIGEKRNQNTFSIVNN